MYVNLYMSLPDVDNVAILVSFFGDMAIFGGKNGDMVIFEFLRYGENMAIFFEKNGDMAISGLPTTPSPPVTLLPCMHKKIVDEGEICSVSA